MHSSIHPAIRRSLLAASLLLGGCGTTPSSPAQDPPGPAAAQLALTSDTLLLTRAGEQTTVRAQAFDSSNEPVPAAVRWSSSNPDISVDAHGRVTANVSAGSAVITAESGPARASVLVAVARTPEGAVTITDENLAGPITPADANASFGLGFRYTVPLKNPPAIEPGQVLINRGRTPVAGRVVQVQGDAVMLEVIPLDEVLPDIDVRAQLPVAMTPDALPQQMRNAFDVTHLPGGKVKFTQKQGSVLRSGGLRALKSEYNLGPFQCESDGDAIAMDLSKTEFILTPDLKVDVEWTAERRKVVVRGQPTVSMEVKPTVSATLTGKVGCRLTLARPVVPLPGPLGLFLGASVPIGVGLEFEGKLPVVGFGIESKAEVGLKYALGMDCRQTCSNVAEAEPIASGNITPKLPELPTGVVPEISAYAFMFAKLEFGAHASERLRVESLEAQGGMKLETKLATEAHQAEQKPVAAEYKLVFEGVLGSGKDFEEFLDLVKVTTAKIEIKPRKELAWSPTGTVTLENPSYKKGDVVIFRLALDPSKVDFPLLRQNIKGFRIYLGEGSTPKWRMLTDFPVISSNSQYTIHWTADKDSVPGQEFVIFADTEAVPLLGIKIGYAALPNPTKGWSGTITVSETLSKTRPADFSHPDRGTFSETFEQRDEYTVSGIEVEYDNEVRLLTKGTHAVKATSELRMDYSVLCVVFPSMEERRTHYKQTDDYSASGSVQTSDNLIYLHLKPDGKYKLTNLHYNEDVGTVPGQGNSTWSRHDECTGQKKDEADSYNSSTDVELDGFDLTGQADLSSGFFTGSFTDETITDSKIWKRTITWNIKRDR